RAQDYKHRKRPRDAAVRLTLLVVASRPVEKKRRGADLRGVEAAPQVGQFFAEAPQPVVRLGEAAGQRPPPQRDLRRRLDLLVRLSMANEPGDPAQGAVGGFKPSRRFRQREAVRLQIGVLPQVLSENVSGSLKLLAKTRFERLQFQRLAAQVTGNGTG